MKITKGWEKIIINQLVQSRYVGDWGTEGEEGVDTPIIRSTNFTNDMRIDYSEIAYRKVDKKILQMRKIFKDSILIEKSGGSTSQFAGRVVFCDLEFEGTTSNFIEIINVKHDYDPKFVAYLLFLLYTNGVVSKYQQQTTGIINFKINEYFHEYIQIPTSKKEQSKIAEVLSTVDKAIEDTEKLIAKQQRIKTGLMQDLLTRGIDENGNIRSEKTHKFKDSPLGRIPVEWEVMSWKDTNEKIQDGTHFSPKTSESESIKYITSKNIKFGYIDLTDVQYIDRVQHNSIYRHCPVQKGDVLLTKDGVNTGNAAINNIEEEFSLLSSVALIRPKKNILLSDFLLQFILSKKGQQMIKDAMSGLAITRITLVIINSFYIIIPDTKEQTKIVNVLNAINNKINSEKENLQKLKSIKTGLMRDLLSGERSVEPLL